MRTGPSLGAGESHFGPGGAWEQSREARTTRPARHDTTRAAGGWGRGGPFLPPDRSRNDVADLRARVGAASSKGSCTSGGASVCMQAILTATCAGNVRGYGHLHTCLHAQWTCGLLDSGHAAYRAAEATATGPPARLQHLHRRPGPVSVVGWVRTYSGSQAPGRGSFSADAILVMTNFPVDRIFVFLFLLSKLPSFSYFLPSFSLERIGVGCLKCLRPPLHVYLRRRDKLPELLER
ncbi:hypothetical protein GGR52DRAFT_67378 [Hypoxylon sp. FL1284]|nr:hypothetical protein GGR52DRAFT_67378 [Hypoxylon sp. FL1284]